MRENKQLLLRMSESDFDQLSILSVEMGVTRNEYLRNVIRINYLIREYANGNTKAKYKNDFGFELSNEMLESFMKKLSDSIEEIGSNMEIQIAKKKPNSRQRQKQS